MMNVSPISSAKPSPRFGFLALFRANPEYQLTDLAMKSMNPLWKGAGKFLQMKEGAGGNAHMQFVQDSSILWAPKFAICRTWLERFEITFLEFIESGCFYYLPHIAGSVLFLKLFQKAAKTDKKFLTSGLKDAAWSRGIPAKLGLAIAGVAFATCSEYALNFAKNIVTEKGFNQNDFSSIIGFTNRRLHRTNEDTHVTRKAKRRMVQSTAIAAGFLLGGLALAKWGAGIKNVGWQKRLGSWAKWFDYDFKAVQDRKTKKFIKNNFDLGGNQLKILMPFAILSYWDAARDRLEKIEAGCRAIVTGSYIAYIQPWAAKVFNRNAHKWFRDGDKVMDGAKKESVKKLEAIQTDCLKEASKRLGKPISDSAVKAEASRLLRPRLLAKVNLFFIPFLFGILGIGLFTALMSQLWTKYRFQLAQKAQQLQVAQGNGKTPPLPVPANRLATPVPRVTASVFVAPTVHNRVFGTPQATVSRAPHHVRILRQANDPAQYLRN